MNISIKTSNKKNNVFHFYHANSYIIITNVGYFFLFYFGDRYYLSTESFDQIASYSRADINNNALDQVKRRIGSYKNREVIVYSIQNAKESNLKLITGRKN
ncbi:MAG: hypothetical protein ACRC2K_13190 [Clostridium sp.]